MALVEFSEIELGQDVAVHHENRAADLTLDVPECTGRPEGGRLVDIMHVHAETLPLGEVPPNQLGLVANGDVHLIHTCLPKLKENQLENGASADGEKGLGDFVGERPQSTAESPGHHESLHAYTA
jgi:hypothetical protein